MIYAYVNSAGYVAFVQQNGDPQTLEGLTIVILEEQLPPSPNMYYSYNINSHQWEDTRTEQQKYNEQCTIVIAKRNDLLYASDWTQIPNNPLTTEQQAAWATYRQELRDISKQSGYPFNVIWPTPPQG